MANSINEKLREIADNSAVKQSLTPIFVCDENLMLCSKSIGASEHVKRPPVRSSLSEHFDGTTLEMLTNEDNEAIIGKFRQSTGETRVIVTKGIVSHQKYYCIIFEPQICFCPTPAPWYILSACDELRRAVHDLLTSPPLVSSKLKLDCTRIARLCDYTTEISPRDEYCAQSSQITRIINSITNEARPHIETIGGNLDTNLNDTEFLSVPYAANELFTLIASLLLAALLMSDNNRISLVCTPSDDRIGYINISFLVEGFRRECQDVTSFDALVRSASPITLELAALSDMAKKLDLDIYCECDGKKLSIGCFIPLRKQKRVIMDMPTNAGGPSYANIILNHLFTVASQQLKTKMQ